MLKWSPTSKPITTTSISLDPPTVTIPLATCLPISPAQGARTTWDTWPLVMETGVRGADTTGDGFTILGRHSFLHFFCTSLDQWNFGEIRKKFRRFSQIFAGFCQILGKLFRGIEVYYYVFFLLSFSCFHTKFIYLLTYMLVFHFLAVRKRLLQEWSKPLTRYLGMV